MRGFREILINERRFRIFHIYCDECNESLVQVSDLTESPLKNEALIRYRINNHVEEERHYSFDGNIEPQRSLQHIDKTITLNNDV